MYGFSDQLNGIPRTRLSAERHGSSRYSTRTRPSIEHVFVQAELEAGIRRLTLPLPVSPGHVHCYLLAGDQGWTLVDTGLALPGLVEALAGVDVRRIVITHFHPDHVGGSGPIAEATGAQVLQGALDYLRCEQVWGSDDWPDRIAAWFRRHGVPTAVADQLHDEAAAARPLIRFARDPARLHGGERVDGWQVLETPGHADGHVCLLRDGILVAGDHLLPDISPTVGLWPDQDADPLGNYLESLELVVRLAPQLALPGHGEPIDDPARRARELLAHHAERLDRTAAALGAVPRTGYEVSLELFGGDLPPSERRFAVAEALSHLEHLVVRGRARRHEVGGGFAYTEPQGLGRRPDS
jgi:glyoxylase-like metal-dependent hydrolase (beta-lactamase superfamily II)